MSSVYDIHMDMDSERIKKDLLRITIEGRWDEAVEVYKQNQWVHKVRINRLGDTVLHTAVADWRDCQEEHVEELVNLVSIEELRIQNEQGNTPLHFAAAMGNVRMCYCIAKKDSSLVGIPNNYKETPLFLAAIHGKKDAFLCLHYLCTPDKSQPRYSYCRREDGETILHCAIAGDYFDLAFQIIRLYKDLVNSVNEDGYSPLHLLASKPSAFKSGDHLRLWNIIIYDCIYVDELKVDDQTHFRGQVPNTINSVKDPQYPENYKTCINFLPVLRVIMAKVLARLVTYKNVDWSIRSGPRDRADAENPKDLQKKLVGLFNTCFDFVKLVSKAMLIVLGLMLIVLGLGSDVKKLRYKKEIHRWAVQIMDELLETSLMYAYEYSGVAPTMSPHKDGEIRPYAIPDGSYHITLGVIKEKEQVMTPPSNTDYQQNDSNQNKGNNGKEKIGEGSVPPAVTKKKIPDIEKKETPILIAAKNGVTEMVEKILELHPVAIHDLNAENKNIVLLAVENRQPHVYQLLLKKNYLTEAVFGRVDKMGNSALHLAANLGGYEIPAAALQMQWEIKFYEFVKNSVPPNFFVRYNKKNQTAREVFTETHLLLVKEGTQWLKKTSESCSVVAALIVTVAFATFSTVPGGIDQESGSPTFENHRAFIIYCFSSFGAAFFSFTSVVIFLSLSVSQYQMEDFGREVPSKLILGLTTLILSMLAMLISFCISHSFMVKDKLNYSALVPLYAGACLPIAYYVILQFPLYYSFIKTTFTKVPVRLAPVT